MFAFCLSLNCMKWISLRHIFDIRAALEGKPIFFNSFHISLGFWCSFGVDFLRRSFSYFFIFYCTELLCSLRRSWSTWSFLLKNLPLICLLPNGLHDIAIKPGFWGSFYPNMFHWCNFINNVLFGSRQVILCCVNTVEIGKVWEIFFS